MASTPAVLVGMPLSTDEVRTDLAVVQGAVVQGTPLTRQLSQSAKKLAEASVKGLAAEKEEISLYDKIGYVFTFLVAGELPLFRTPILPIILLVNYRDNNWADAYCEKDIAEWALSPPYRLEPRTSQPMTAAEPSLDAQFGAVWASVATSSNF